MRSISIQIRTSCDKCGGPLPLNAMVNRLACPACSASNELSDELWQTLLGDDLGSSTVITHRRQFALEVEGGGPACAECGAAIPVGEALAAADAGALACGGCGTPVSVRVPPAPFVVSGFRLIVGEDALQLPASGAVARTGNATQPVAFTCPQCAGVLQVDGAARVVKCGYCSASVYLPDDLWHVFHPVQKARPWYLLRHPGARRDARRDAKNDATSPERLDELSRHLEYDVRVAVARHPRTPVETLRRLVTDDDSLAGDVAENPALAPELIPLVASRGGWWVMQKLARSAAATPDTLALVLHAAERKLTNTEDRDPDDDEAGEMDFSDVADVMEALAGHPAATGEILAGIVRINRGRGAEERRSYEEAIARHAGAPPAALEELSRTSHEWVRREVARHPATSAAVLERLAADADEDTREAAAARPELSPETLQRLAKDPADAVRAAARGNPSYPRFGWIKKLFGG